MRGELKLRFYKTLSWRLVIITVALISAVLAAVLFLVAMTLRTYLIDEVDKSLTSSGKLIASQTVEQLVNGSQTQVLPSNFYFYVHLNGTNPVEVIHSQVREDSGVPEHPEQLAKTASSQPQTVHGTRHDIEWRTITVELRSQLTAQSAGTVVIAHPLTSVHMAVDNLIHMMTLMSLAIILLGALLSYLLVQRSLRHLRTIEQATHAVAAGDLSTRIPPAAEGTEIGLLGDSINDMLGKIERAFKIQQKSEQNMRRFVSDASHELRTPLATVRGYAELYRLGGVPENEVSRAFERVESEASRMGDLVEDLLQLARLDEGRPLNLTKIELASIAENAISDFHARAPERAAKVVALNGADVEPVVVLADQNRITQVIANLLNNALTHTPEGTPVEVAVGISEETSHAIIEVRDHGNGIDEENRERIFERFFRIDDSRCRDSGGSGLGLAIVSAITQAHGGTASVHETPGGGLTVRITLPHVDDDATARARLSS
ncbi:two-component system OmpR family sensor kinase [Arcanobacterium pluranimalium]|uniref:ATP-binding protein n=1 Tax=Arcanobacterium pluranimalium TaxID=108028 RepID=UPI00195854F2|nr:two-component system OmpR family sensor kinase [Arcanobacterium pluranimalium]